MADRVWGAGSLMTGNWNTASCWTGDAVPGASDKAIFNATDVTDCRINVAINITELEVLAAYTGKLNFLTDNLNHSFSGNVTIASEVDIEDSILTISGNLDLTGSTWNKYVETIKMTGAVNKNITLDGYIHKLEVNKSSSAIITCIDALLVDKLVMTSGKLKIVNNQTAFITELSGVNGEIYSDNAGHPATISLMNTAESGIGGVTFKDIYMNLANRINGKTCTNSGGNLGIVFKDELG